jgi:hypothetical protein
MTARRPYVRPELTPYGPTSLLTSTHPEPGDPTVRRIEVLKQLLAEAPFESVNSNRSPQDLGDVMGWLQEKIKLEEDTLPLAEVPRGTL